MITVVSSTLVLVACGDDARSTADAVTEASTCAELVDAYEVDAVTSEEAELIADRLVELAEADFADDGVLDQKLACNQVIRELDPRHSGAFEGIDLEEEEMGESGRARNG